MASFGWMQRKCTFSCSLSDIILHNNQQLFCTLVKAARKSLICLVTASVCLIVPLHDILEQQEIPVVAERKTVNISKWLAQTLCCILSRSGLAHVP